LTGEERGYWQEGEVGLGRRKVFLWRRKVGIGTRKLGVVIVVGLTLTGKIECWHWPSEGRGYWREKRKVCRLQRGRKVGLGRGRKGLGRGRKGLGRRRNKGPSTPAAKTSIKMSFNCILCFSL
jgi:hypothetical protein